MTVARLVGVVLGMAAAAAHARAQQVIAPTEHLAFNGPEASALQYFTSATFLMPFDPVTTESGGSTALQVELGWLPALSNAQQQVGFAGTASEDLNKAPIFVRPQVRITVAPRVAVTVAGIPPVRAFGITPNLIALGAEWAFVDREDWHVAVRAHGQTGTVTGAFTCPESVLAFPPGSTGNPTACTTASSDAATLRYGALEVDVGRRLAVGGGLLPHVAVAVNDMNGSFQVDARTYGNIDHTRLDMTGVTWSTTAGASVRLSSRFDGSIDVLYAPLFVRRSSSGPVTTDALVTVHGAVTYRIRK